MKANTITPTLKLLRMGVKSKTRCYALKGKRLYLFRLFKWGSFSIWWGFIIYLIFNWCNG
jgi:hypothetical protein